jgi:hypothetical protein
MTDVDSRSISNRLRLLADKIENEEVILKEFTGADVYNDVRDERGNLVGILYTGETRLVLVWEDRKGIIR